MCEDTLETGTRTQTLSNSNIMNMHTPEQISKIVLKVLQELNKTDVSKLSTEEKLKLAKDPNATVEILQGLSRDKDYYVRYWVARNPKATVEILQSLAQDKDSRVRYWVSRHPNATVEILQGLSRDKDYYVRYGVAGHPNATIEILQGLAQDENSYVREKAMKNPNYKPKTLELTSAQYEALKTLLESSQDEILKTLTL